MANGSSVTGYLIKLEITVARSWLVLLQRDFWQARRGLLLFLAVVASWSTAVSACPFCTAISSTLSDELEEAKAAVVASVSTASDGHNVRKPPTRQRQNALHANTKPMRPCDGMV